MRNPRSDDPSLCALFSDQLRVVPRGRTCKTVVTCGRCGITLSLSAYSPMELARKQVDAFRLGWRQSAEHPGRHYCPEHAP